MNLDKFYVGLTTSNIFSLISNQGASFRDWVGYEMSYLKNCVKLLLPEYTFNIQNEVFLSLKVRN